DDSTWATLGQAVKVHATDPEGTDITFPTPPEFWGGPHGTGHQEIIGEWQGRKELRPGDAAATGVIAGTWDHSGPFPAIRVSFNNDHADGIEGGGAYGDNWRAIVDKYKNVTWPTKQGPGLFSWLIEAALGTNPKWTRPRNALTHAMG